MFVRRRKERKRRAVAGSDDSNREDPNDSESEPEPFEEMYSIFRIVALYEMMMHGQWTYVNRYMKDWRPSLVVGMYIGSAFEMIRFVCVLIIVIVSFLMRISVITPFTSIYILGNANWVSTMNNLCCWTSVLLCALIFTQFAVYQCNSRLAIVIVTSFNFLFSIILIACAIHLAVWHDHHVVMMKEGLYKRHMANSHAMTVMNDLETRMKCCGVDGPEDYEQTHLINYVNPLTNVTERIKLTREFAIDNGHFYSLPVSCCKPVGRRSAQSSLTSGVCSQRNLTDEEQAEVSDWETNQQWDLMLKYFVLPEPGTYYTRGCLLEYVEASSTYALILLVCLVIFTLFTACTIGFVIVLLLYHDSVGHMVSGKKMFGSERNTGVHFLMSLDQPSTDFQDDFSLIEFLRKSDIDRFMAADRLGSEITGGRKEAEQI